MKTQPPTPTVTCTSNGRLVLTREHQDLAANLGALVRYAVTRTSSEESCAALLGVSVRRLRKVAGEARVPLVFVADSPAKKGGRT
ncbi:hypothetical protein SAMN02745121_03048 [Nannocystis exedens]|uniref:Uncharacterized protein n=1 Tax=Nannocystis exedens TaxID=54 RepID=A0A1I1XUH1_9BACT|nr:hypothetical protein [Nannocystis exedens]PCC73225.1 hypothetical protein NAEX_06313 [Nannocystis exedens]SFE10308.1 hypothetical protein SAMN02745121_03048 [Nannocystis exedens]